MTWLLASRFGLPTYVWIVAAVGIGVIAFTLWLQGERREAVALAAAAASAAAATRARKADEQAHEATEAKSEEVGASNRAAADAATKSDDPLKAGLDALRNRQR